MDYAIAMKWYMKAASRGYDSTQCNSGELHKFGRGVLQD